MSEHSRSLFSCLAAGVAATLSLPLALAAAAEPSAPPVTKAPSREAEIRAGAAAFVNAFNHADAVAIAAMFTPSATEADDEGEVLRGQTAIRDEYARLFNAYPGAKIVVAVKSIDFPTPEVAIEEGLSQVSAEHVGPPVISRYTAVHVLSQGKWLMANVHEAKIAVQSNYAKVESLRWLVGAWKAQRDGKTVYSQVSWIANKSFLQRDYKIVEDGIVNSTGTQIIGWDAKVDKIRSWSFDAAGGHGTGVWTATPDGWQIEQSGVMPDGTPTASRDVLIRVPGEDNVLGWKSVARSVGNTKLPDTPEVVLDRVTVMGANAK